MTAPTVTTKGIDGLAETEPPSNRSIGGDSRLHLDISDGPVVVPEHHYRRGDEHARGGLGRIVRGRDQRLGRAVAIKELLHETTINRARFMREARITARLQHPGIVPIYEAGVWPNGQPFYAMRLVAGKPLSQAITACESLADRMALLSPILIVAETMAYAHSERVIHRDLKPANILVGDYGETVVIDWGIAKELDQPETDGTDAASILASAELTVDGQVMGTPWYMAPEQARGELVDERADVYAIGAMIYHLLAGVPPHSGTTDKVVTAVAAGVAPPPLPTRVTGVPADLVAVVDKAMAVDREARYPSAAELAADLRRFLDGRLVSVHRYGLGALLRRWVSRHRGAVAVGAAALVAIVVGGAIGLASIFAARDEARRQEALATTRAHELGAQRDTLLLAQAESALERDPTQALVWLKQYPEDGAEWNRVRSIAADAQSRGVSKHVLQHGEVVWDSAATEDGSRIAVASDDHVSIWDARTGTQLAVYEHPDSYRIEMSRDGRVVAVAGMSKEIFVWSDGIATPKVLSGHTGRVMRLRMTRSGHLVSFSVDGTIRIWPPSGAAPAVIPTIPDAYLPPLLHDETELVAIAPDGVLQTWSLDGRAGRRLGTVVGKLRAITASPSGRVAVSDAEGVRVWPAGGADPQRYGIKGQDVVEVAFVGDEMLLAVSGSAVTAWRLADGHEMALTGHNARLTSLAISPGGVIATGDAAGGVRLWRYVADAGEYAPTALIGHRAYMSSLLFSSDGRTLLTTSHDYTTRLWQIPPQREIAHRVDARSLVELAYLDDGASLVVSSGVTARVVLVLRNGSPPRELGQHSDSVFSLSVSGDGNFVASASIDGTFGLWDRRTDTWTKKATGSTRAQQVALSRDGAWLAVAGDRGVYLGSPGDELVPLPGEESGAKGVQFSPDGRSLATAGADNAVRLWNMPSRTLRFTLRGHHKEPAGPIFTPDGRYLVTNGWDGEVRRWDTSTGEGWLLGQHRAAVRTLAISADGGLAASAGLDGEVRLWDLNRRSGSLLGEHGGEVRGVAFSPDGRSLASASFDGTVKLWDLATRSSVPLRGVGKFFRVAFRPDGRELAAVSDDGAVHLWALPLPDAVPTAPREVRGWLDKATTAARSRSAEAR